MIKMTDKVLHWLFSIAGLMGICLIFLPQMLGYVPRIVISGSMEPAVPVGSIAYINRRIAQEEIKKDDVIAYELSGEMSVLHRVVCTDTKKRTWTTKGDANTSCDIGEVSYEQYLGKMIFCIPYAGYVWMGMKKKEVWMIIGIMGIVLMLVRDIRFGKEKSA